MKEDIHTQDVRTVDGRTWNSRGKNESVYGIYKSRAQADSAVERILKEGFSQDDVSVLFADKESTREFAHKKNTKAPEGTTTGGIIGGVVGGAIGVLAGVGSISIPGLGPFIAAGPIMALLAGAGAGGTVGGIIGALVGMGIPEYEAKRYEGRVKEGGILLSVHCDTSDEIDKAENLLKETGAEDVSSAGESSVDTSSITTRDTTGRTGQQPPP